MSRTKFSAPSFVQQLSVKTPKSWIFMVIKSVVVLAFLGTSSQVDEINDQKNSHGHSARKEAHKGLC